MSTEFAVARTVRGVIVDWLSWHKTPVSAQKEADRRNAKHCAGRGNEHLCCNDCENFIACDPDGAMIDRPSGTVDCNSPDPFREIRNVL